MSEKDDLIKGCNMDSQIKKASAFSQDVKNIQDVLTGNAEKLGVSIATPIGNDKTGQSDGKLGQRTSNALEQLVMLAREYAKQQKPDNPLLKQGADNKLGTQPNANMQFVEDYLKNRGLSAADVSKMMTSLETVSAKDGNKPSLLDRHYTTGQVSEVKLPEVKKDPAPVVGAPPAPVKTDFNKVAPPAPAPVVAAPPVVKVKVTLDEYEELRDKIKGGEVVSDADKVKAKAFETALDTYKKGGDYAKASASFDAAKLARDTGDQTKEALEATKTRIEHDPKIQAGFKELEKKDVTVNVDGQDYTYSKAALDKEYGMRWNDSDLVTKIRNAVDAKLEGMNADYKAYHEADRQLDGFDNRLNKNYNDAYWAFDAQKKKVEASGFALDVTLPAKGASQPAEVSPAPASVTPPVTALATQVPVAPKA